MVAHWRMSLLASFENKFLLHTYDREKAEHEGGKKNETVPLKLWDVSKGLHVVFIIKHVNQFDCKSTTPTMTTTTTSSRRLDEGISGVVFSTRFGLNELIRFLEKNLLTMRRRICICLAILTQSNKRDDQPLSSITFLTKLMTKTERSNE